jgi:hypothetical protein
MYNCNCKPGDSGNIRILAGEVRALRVHILELQRQYQLLLDHLNLVVNTIPAQPARQELKQKGKDGENKLSGGAAGW